MKKFYFFWGHTPKKEGEIDKSCLSQWFDRGFIVDDIEYKNAEQYMMAKKALLFGDTKIFNKIMNLSDPKLIKNLGRKVKGFVEEVWNENCEHYVYDANFAKFSQNKDLKDFILSIEEDIIVEASPYDKVWGIGLSAYDKRALNVETWKGLNKLGYALTKVREDIRRGY